MRADQSKHIFRHTPLSRTSVLAWNLPRALALVSLLKGDGFPSWRLVVTALSVCITVLLLSETGRAQNQQNRGSGPISQFLVRTHSSKATSDSGGGDTEAIARETADAVAGKIEQPVMTPTRSSFLAKWQPVKGATGYRLDVSTTPSFDHYVNNYRDVDVGNVTGHIVSGLGRGTRYYYRVRPYTSSGAGSNSEVTSETTANVSSGLVIIPTFDSTITNDPRSNAIQAMITNAIAKYQALFADPITVSIRFRFSSVRPDGTPLNTLVGASNSGIHQLDWDTYISALKADGTTANDMNANATLPNSALSPIMLTNSALGRAVGLNTPPVMFADGSLGTGGPYDGIITINTLYPVQFTRPVSAGNLDGEMFTEHEIDEVLGTGSHIDTPAPQFLCPIDLFTWASLNARNTSSSGQRFFSIDQGFHLIVQFNQSPGGDFGDYDSDSFCPANRLFVQNAFNCPGQAADVTASSPEGISLDVMGYDLIPTNSVLGNISTRLPVGTGENVLIAGFKITGSTAKQLLLRALGPTLGQPPFNVPGALGDTTLELHDSTGAVIATNDDWQQASNASSIPANLRPPNHLESAILITLNPGTYTAILRGYQNSTGIALVEVFDTSVGSTQLSNISTRGFVQTGNNVMIAGVIVQFHNKGILVRALGPTLAGFGVANPLPDPMLELHDSNGAIIASNDDWRETQQSIIAATGLAPPNDRESAIAGTIAPGNYTAVVRGFNNAIGVALVEVYALN